MSEPKKSETAPVDTGGSKTTKPTPLADCKVLKHRARIAGVQLAKGTRVALPMDVAKPMEAAGLVEIVGVADAQK